MSVGCVRKTLSTFPYGNIQECSCGGYYVTFGYVTLRLSYAELKSYSETLSKLVESIEGDSEDDYSGGVANKKAIGRSTL